MNKTIILISIFLIALAASVPSPAVPRDTDEPGKLYFTFVSSAYFMDKRWGSGMPWDGIERTAGIAHRNGVPVTWLVNPESARLGADLFRGYHEKYGDAIGHIITGNKDEAARWGGESFFFSRLSYSRLGKRVAGELGSIRESLPWADVMVGGSGYRSEKMARVLMKLGYSALWGHCWEQTLTDGISDRGVPWGFYYVSPEAFKAPNRKPGGLVGIEWTARDLNLAFRTGRPEVYSTDPNDVERAGICSHRDIEYWKRLVDQYIRNTAYNEMVPLAVHQEAHEMECTGRICSNDADTIESTEQMLDELFKYMRSRGVKTVTANEAVRAYRSLHDTTPPTYALFDDVLLDRYPEALVYYDVNGQLFFEKGKKEPLLIRNYIDAADTSGVEFAVVKKVPRPECEEGEPGVWECMVESPERLPYGLAFWGDYSGIEVKAEAAAKTKILPGEAAFVSFVLESGENSLEIELD